MFLCVSIASVVRTIIVNAVHAPCLLLRSAAGYGTYAYVNMILTNSAFSVILANGNYGQRTFIIRYS
ncbi:hypothetical protein PILCRDRAFT_825197 [Piloderma croceum F 1598]|uniref:Uncharacterized protein n=1 Tax=Piloderma croceum (strain F 1598) TaxID=765440 RepID=A0A0C3BJV3_PILCF|nr:hypothetical protein PILCRDRAFT_825197 [Piloderma croceum F 1598]